jgi:hypothetical protein
LGKKQLAPPAADTNSSPLVAEIIAKPHEVDRGYMARELVLCTLPHRDPGDMPAWGRRNGNLTLILQPGIDRDTMKPLGFPYGSIPRLLLFWLTSEATRTRDRTIKLGSSLNDFLRAVGLNPNTGGGKRSDAKRLHEQMTRLFNSRISFDYREGDDTKGRTARLNMQVVSKSEAWWDFRQPDQGALFESYVVLGEDFFDAILAAPVPIDFRALKALKRSPFALDLYAWATWRVWTLREAQQEQTDLPLALLQEQFGAEYTRADNFKAALEDGLAAVKAVFPALDYTLTTKQLIIRTGKAPVPKISAEKQFRQIEKPKAGRVTLLTRGQFQEIYPRHDVRACLKDFYAWVEKKEIAAHDIDKLFLTFAAKWVAGKE